MALFISRELNAALEEKTASLITEAELVLVNMILYIYISVSKCETLS